MFWKNWEQYSYYENVKLTVIAIVIFLLFIFLRKIFAKYVFAILLRLTQKAPGELFTSIVKAFEKPMQWLFIIIGIYIAAGYFPYFENSSLLFLHLVRSSIIFLIGWGLFNLSSSTSLFFEKVNEKTNVNIDKILIPILSKAVRVIIVVIIVGIIADEFNYNINGFVAGLGLGGLAFALAAQNVLTNLLGGVVIITEKPFTIGDWISTTVVEGTVENITFRSTKVRTFDQGLVTVPNSTLANNPITNWSKMGKRRVSFNVRLPHDTDVDKVQFVIGQIKEMLQNHPGVHHEKIYVIFDQFKENDLDVKLDFFTKTTEWEEYLKVKEDINLQTLNILQIEEAKQQTEESTGN